MDHNASKKVSFFGSVRTSTRELLDGTNTQESIKSIVRVAKAIKDQSENTPANNTTRRSTTVVAE